MFNLEGEHIEDRLAPLQDFAPGKMLGKFPITHDRFWQNYATQPNRLRVGTWGILIEPRILHESWRRNVIRPRDLVAYFKPETDASSLEGGIDASNS